MEYPGAEGSSGPPKTSQTRMSRVHETGRNQRVYQKFRNFCLKILVYFIYFRDSLFYYAKFKGLEIIYVIDVMFLR